MTDIEIAESIKPLHIDKVAKKLKLKKRDYIALGHNKAKITKQPFDSKSEKKLVLVTAITPNSAGIGKTTVSIGLADGLRKLGKKACLALREPSLGPVFGIKGGATGGGYSQIIPMADINLHFTGDFHAITSANNLLCSMIDNHIYQGNALKIDSEQIMFHRCLDLNDRALRHIVVGNTKGETPRADYLSITSASEIMAIMCLSQNLHELKERLGNILVAYTKKGKPIFCKDLQAVDAMAILLKDALYPNLVQTLEGTPAIVHLGPFANIAHGCNSITATKLSMSLADYTITEAGFGSDLGGEKFLDIKCRLGQLNPNAVVIVATLPALRMHGEATNPKEPNVEAVKIGIQNLLRHVDIIKKTYKLPLVVAINKYANDSQEEIDALQEQLNWVKVPNVVCNPWGEGGNGCLDLANAIITECDKPSKLHFAYKFDDTIENKINNIVTKVYKGKGVILSDLAKEKIKLINRLGFSHLPIVIAKTQYSLSDDPKKINAPEDFDVTIRDIELKSGAGFIVAIAGNMMLMPGLGKSPASIKMTISDDGIISGLF